ncbi:MULTISPECIES: YdaS family helix-turn-helix protein [unclassified Pseudoalteromonas]|uniref:YdaS family helix-turn-helix protein n=1 Tax=unclassified Pseudoalteromonas TaxID=194690 RepID=UPI0015FF6C6D|nr:MULTISPECIES: YdaS family helix-turn-helix protein [unclassified Pseudoalteromonas]MBB1333892.1 helix-turn-helix domain-containing protein [Pseudoalteromonas sp. SR41-6]MBB1459613.1 helix-turn-helix domain-containing protein [Pseudoalteromonas sp. SG41-8]
MSAIDKAVKIIGGQTKLATVLGTKQSVVHHWVSRHGQAPAKYIPRISELTNGEVSVNDLLADHQKRNKENAA